MFGVEEYPDVDVVQQHTLALYQLNHFRYVESVSMLGIKWPPE